MECMVGHNSDFYQSHKQMVETRKAQDTELGKLLSFVGGICIIILGLVMLIGFAIGWVVFG